MLTDEQIDTIGYSLEEHGFTHSQIDEHFAHFGVKGMRWGVRRDRRRASREANKALRKENWAKQAKTVDKARANSVKFKQDIDVAKAEYKQAKKYGSADDIKRTKKALQNARKKSYENDAVAQQARDGKELVGALALTGVMAVAYGALTYADLKKYS